MPKSVRKILPTLPAPGFRTDDQDRELVRRKKKRMAYDVDKQRRKTIKYWNQRDPKMIPRIQAIWHERDLAATKAQESPHKLWEYRCDTCNHPFTRVTKLHGCAHERCSICRKFLRAKLHRELQLRLKMKNPEVVRERQQRANEKMKAKRLAQRIARAEEEARRKEDWPIIETFKSPLGPSPVPELSPTELPPMPTRSPRKPQIVWTSPD